MDVAVTHLADEVRAGRRELVDPARAVDDERAPRPELREHLRDRAHERGRVHADHLSACACGIRQRPEHVEDRQCGELAPDRCRVAHRRVMRRSEQEAEAELVDRAFDPRRRKLEPEAERLEHVCRPGCGRDRAVAVLRDTRTRGRRDQGRRGRDVDRPCAVAAGAGGVDQVVPRRLDREHMRAHRFRAAGDLVHGLALQAQRDEQAADLRRGRVADHHLVHHRTGLVAREVVSVEQPAQRLLDVHAASRKFFASCGPTGVSTDSGWN